MCPCGSQVAEAACCGRYLAGAPAPTALALMRSRYTAYTRGAVEYLIATQDAATRATLDRADLVAFTKATLFLDLEIVATERGGEADDEGFVEFIARGASRGQPFAQRERSRFRRVDGRWFYVDGKLR